MGRVGDALQEPFWPEGLGINRGFLGALDFADLVQGYATLARSGLEASAAPQAQQLEALLERREMLFAYTKRVSGTNRLTELKPPIDSSTRKYSYAIEPSSRYTALPADLPPKPRPAQALLEELPGAADVEDFRI